jgi:hypothetical protein
MWSFFGWTRFVHLVPGDGRQTFALREVEDGEALKERDRLRFLAGLPGAPLLVVGNEALGVDDRRAALALADVAAEAERLVVISS